VTNTWLWVKACNSSADCMPSSGDWRGLTGVGAE
jgi:hypothetical protein